MDIQSPESSVNPNEREPMDIFWDKWGDFVGLSHSELSFVWENGLRTYPGKQEMAFHNDEHAIKVTDDCMIMAQELMNNGVSVDTKALFTASIYHDALYKEDFAALECDSREELAAKLYENDMGILGLPEDTIETGRQAIMATKVGVKPKSIEDIIIRRADLANVAEDYEFFIHRTEQLGSEIQHMKGEPCDSDVLYESSIKVLCAYFDELRESIEQTIEEPNFANFKNVSSSYIKFVVKAVGNLNRLALELARSKHESHKEFVKRLGGSAVNMLLPQKD